MESHNNHGFWYGFNIAAITLVILFILGLPLLKAGAYLVQSVDMRASQSETAYAYVPTTFTIDITNPQHDLLNAVEFELSYNPQDVLIMSIVPHTTLCEEQFVITNKINTASGTALFQCGTITPFSETAGTIATVHALPLKAGTTTITFGDTTHVLAHDGLGTDKTRERIALQMLAQ